METRTYTERSNARRAAKAAGVDPTLVFETEDGFTFPPAAADAIIVDATKQAPPDHCTYPNCKCIVSTSTSEPTPKCPKGLPPAITKEVDNLDIPASLKRPPPTPEQLAAMEDIRRRTTGPERIITMSKATPDTKARAKSKDAKADKNAMLLSMLKGKGSSVEQLTKALDWLPHSLRARLSRLSKSKAKGGEGLKIERQRTDGVTTYRIV